MKAKSVFIQNRIVIVTIVLLVLWNALVWLKTDSQYLSSANTLIQQETQIAHERSDDLADSIRRNLGYLHGIPELFAQATQVRNAVRKFGTAPVPSALEQAARRKKLAADLSLRELNNFLAYAAKSLNAEIIYVVNAAGESIAASNWNTTTSSLGINIAERSMFKQNKIGLNGLQYAVGKTTKIPGLYFSTPIFIDGRFYGAVVAKADIPGLSFLINQINAFVADDNGVIILARNAKLEMNALPEAAISKLSLEEKFSIYQRGDFPALQINSWQASNFPTLLRVGNADVPHILVSKRVNEFNLTVYVDSELTEVAKLKREFFWFAFLIAALGSVLILVVSGSTVYFQSIRRSKKMLWKQANFDTLSGLPNRDLLRDRLSQEIIKSERSGLPLAVMLIDLDQFKEVNDTLGHDMGDILLAEAARRLSACVRESDTVARLGGDEFIVVLPQVSNAGKIGEVAQKINTSLASPFHLHNETVHVSASIGVTLYPNDASCIDGLMKNADQAMYVAKKNGRNRYSYYTRELHEAAQKRMRMGRDLRAALAKNQLKVYFQPIVEMSTGEVYKAEALLRWQHPEHGMIYPADFIPIAEETGLIIDIGAWVREQAAVWCKRWDEICPHEFQVSVNKSPIEFMDDSHTSNISLFIKRLHNHKLSGSNFVFEITEGMLLNLTPSVIAKLVALSDAGIQVALDDFGTGYSSLSYLKKFDIDYLKIDRTFVSNLGTDADDLILCVAIISMAHKLGLQVVAEGVETEEQHRLLAQAGCDFAQGYHYSAAIPPEQFEIWLNERRASPVVSM